VPLDAPGPAVFGMPGQWADAAKPALVGKEPIAWIELDLDDTLCFSSGILILTQDGLVALVGAAGKHTARAWQLKQGMQLVFSDYQGVGAFELIDQGVRCALWRTRIGGRSRQAARLLQAFEESLGRLAQGPAIAPRPTVWLCPKCQSPLDPAEEECAECVQRELKPPSTWTLLRLWRFAHPYRLQLLWGFLLTLASTAATLVPPYLTIPLMDDVLIPFQSGQPIDWGLVGWLLFGLFASAAVAWSLGWAKTYVLALVSERIGADLRTATYDHLLKLSLEYFGRRRTGDLMARIGSETDRINVFLSLHLLEFATDVLMIAMTAVILFTINPALALATLIPLPFIVWLVHVVRDRLRTGFERIDRVWSEVTNVLADTIPGIRVVKAFAQEDRESERFREANRYNLEVNDRLNRLWSLFSPTVTLLTEIGLLVIWGFGIWLIAQGSVTVGVLTAFLTYIGRFYTRLDSMSRIVSVTQKAAAGAKRIFDILDQVSSVPEPARPVALPKIEGALSLRNIGFRYANRVVIRKLNLEIMPGEMIGLVGHSGSGKSTLVNLICRFYDVADGAILVDGVDIRSVKISDYRKNIGLVLQEPFLFFGTIAENIAYGRPNASRAEIVAAARAAHAHEFILRLPLGYDSLVGERGQGLSGGERQRISIARALLINPRILIMDEATSSVDTETEKEIQKALDNLVEGRTTIAIAHRLSTLRKANRLVVMDQGEIVEIGSHDELMAAKGAYYRLYQAQIRQQVNEQALFVKGEVS
jgi:ATP-binding cassette, subfamily B, bacterial